MKAEELIRYLVGVLEPQKKMLVSEWADEFRFLSPESAIEPGKWVTSRAEYQRGMMDAVNEDGVEEIVFETSAQVGKSEILNNILGYFINRDPCPIAFMQPSIMLAQDYKKDRIYPMFRDTPVLQHLAIAKKKKGSSDTILHSQFQGGNLTMLGAGSPANMAGRPKRLVLLDEIDRMEVTKEGDAVALLFKRTNNYWNRLKVVAATPTDERSRVDAKYKESDMRKFFVKCPCCKEKIIFFFNQLDYIVDEETNDVSNVTYRCQKCNSLFEEKHKASMVSKGEWISTNPKGKKGVVGFWINELYSPWRRWEEIILDYLEAKKTEETLKVWVNTSKGEIFERKGDAPKWSAIFNRRESYDRGIVPNSLIKMITAGVDIQGDRIHIEIVGWGFNFESWSLDYKVLTGLTSNVEVWNKLDEEICRPYYREDGKKFIIELTAIDASYATQTVYNFTRRYDKARVIAVMGSHHQKTLVGSPRRIDIRRSGKKFRKGNLSWFFGVSMLKRELYSFLKIKERKGAFGFCHFPEYDKNYFKELTAEYIVRGFDRRGYPTETWEKKSDTPNEALDCRNYARGCAELMKQVLLDEAVAERYMKRYVDADRPLTVPYTDSVLTVDKDFKRTKIMQEFAVALGSDSKKYSDKVEKEKVPQKVPRKAPPKIRKRKRGNSIW